MPRANPITIGRVPHLYVQGVKVMPVDYVELGGVILVTVRTVDGQPTLRGRCSKLPYWMPTDSIQVEKSEITVCQHAETYTETTGSRRFSGGDVDDDIEQHRYCRACGAEIMPPAPTKLSDAELDALMIGMI